MLVGVLGFILTQRSRSVSQVSMRSSSARNVPKLSAATSSVPSRGRKCRSLPVRNRGCFRFELARHVSAQCLRKTWDRNLISKRSTSPILPKTNLIHDQTGPSPQKLVYVSPPLSILSRKKWGSEITFRWPADRPQLTQVARGGFESVSPSPYCMYFPQES